MENLQKYILENLLWFVGEYLSNESIFIEIGFELTLLTYKVFFGARIC